MITATYIHASLAAEAICSASASMNWFGADRPAGKEFALVRSYAR